MVQRPAFGYGGYGQRGGPPEVASATVDVDQLQRDIDRSQVGGWLGW